MNAEDPRFAKWSRWLKEIRKDIESFLFYCFIRQEVFDIVDSNPEIDRSNPFFAWMLLVYGEAAAAGVRRQIDKHPDVISFAKLLNEICSAPWLVPVKPEEVENDLKHLIQKSEITKKYVDKVIAHSDKKKPDELPTYKELDECLDFLYELVRKYCGLFFRSLLPEKFGPVVQFDWKAIFRQAWINS